MKRALLLALVTLLVACGQQAPDSADIRLPTLDAGRFSLSSQRGKVVVLAFWSTTCVVCKKQLLEMHHLRDAFGPDQADRLMLATVCSDAENLAAAKAIAANLGLRDRDLPVLLDENAQTFRRLGLAAYPTTLVFAPDGRLSLTRVGYDAGVLRDLEASVLRLAQEAD